MKLFAKTEAACLSIVAFIILSALVASAPTSAETIRVAHDNTSHAAPFFVAEKRGFYDAEGIKVQRRITTSRGLIDALVGGTVDIISTRGDRMGIIAARGVDVIAIGLVRDGNQNMVLVRATDTSSKSVKDLVGKTVGAQLGTGSWFVWVKYLSRIGLSPKDFVIRNITTDSIPAAFAAGELDAALTWEPFGSLIIEKGLGRMVMSPKEYETVLGYTSPVVLTTTESYFKQHRDALLRFMRAHIRAIRFLDTHRNESAQLMSEFWRAQGLQFSPEKAKKDLYTFTLWNRVAISPQDIKEVQDGIDEGVRTGQLKTRIDVTAHIDTTLEREAEGSLRNH